MKTDNYLNLCLEQAAKSPLRYRHGCIIVRGGKVIGQGFNDHRSGYDGGALKTGRLPARSLDTAALAELKKKRKLKRDLKNPNLEAVTTFTPFEAMSGGGKQANTPLSMHSEMMAIHSALSASRALVSMAVSSQKPYFKLSGDSKRKARLRRDAIKTYAKTICRFVAAQSTEQRAGQPQVQDWQSEGGAPHFTLCVSGNGSIERSRVSSACGGQYRETPNKESEGSSTRTGRSRSRWSTQQAPTVCA